MHPIKEIKNGVREYSYMRIFIKQERQRNISYEEGKQGKEGSGNRRLFVDG